MLAISDSLASGLVIEPYELRSVLVWGAVFSRKSLGVAHSQRSELRDRNFASSRLSTTPVLTRWPARYCAPQKESCKLNPAFVAVRNVPPEQPIGQGRLRIVDDAHEASAPGDTSVMGVNHALAHLASHWLQ